MTLLDGLIDNMHGKPAERRRFGYPRFSSKAKSMVCEMSDAANESRRKFGDVVTCSNMTGGASPSPSDFGDGASKTGRPCAAPAAPVG